MKASPHYKISFVVVNYNVKEYLAQSIQSLERALKKIPYEIWLVDNNSVDGSVAYISKNFPSVNIIANDHNVGFGRANNQALDKVQGDFVVLINPDTVVQEDTFTKLLEFFNQTPDASVATCKIINPDGSFSVDCRHSIPTPLIAFWKVTGLSKLFQKSNIFGKYNLTYLDPDQTYSVPAISGSFMMIKKDALDKIGHFDERFFMYCEDIDLCYRLNKSGFRIFYVPTTQIVHYKGESTKKDKLDYVITFNRSLYKFFQKYYAPSSIFLFRWIVAIGIFLRAIFIYFRNFLRVHFPLVLDTIILNMNIMLSFIIRLELGRGFLWQDYLDQFWIINLIATVLFLTISFYFEIYPNHRFSVQAIMKVNMLTFILLAFLTFFLKQFAYSRMVVLLTFILSPILMMLWRIFLRRYYRGDKSPLGKDLFSKPTLVVGNRKDVNILFNKLESRTTIDYDLMGWVSLQDEPDRENESDDKYLGTLTNLKDIIKFHGIRQIIFSAQSLSYEKILKTMSTFGTSLLEFKMVPSNLDVVIGKSHIEKLDDYPLLDIDYSIGKKYNRFVKRLVDLSVSFFLLILSAPIFLVSYLIQKSELVISKIYGHKGQSFDIVSSPERKRLQIVQNWYLLKHVFLGRLSLVGAPIKFVGKQNGRSDYLYKPGITGLVQINRKKIRSRDEEEKFHLYYLKNQSLLLDAEIMLKGLFNYFKRIR